MSELWRLQCATMILRTSKGPESPFNKRPAWMNASSICGTRQRSNWLRIFHIGITLNPPTFPPKALQNLASIATTNNGRLLAWPNTLRYKAEPLLLLDPSRPGHLRYITIHLVDPHYRICSTRNVPPQQHDWWPKAAGELFKLPLPEILDMLHQQTEGWPLTTQESLEIQKQTESERERKPWRSCIVTVAPGTTCLKIF